MHNTRWDGNVPFYVSTGQIQVRFLLHIPDNGTGDATVLAHVWTNGTAALWEISYFSGGGLAIKVYDGSSSTAIYTSGIGTFKANGKLLRVSLEMTESGGNVNWTLATLEVGQTIGGTISGTVTGRTVSSARQVIICPHLNQDQVAIGHVTVESAVTSLFDLFLQLNAYSGVTAHRVLASGTLPVQLPRNGGRRYDTSVTLTLASDSQVPDSAAWLLHLGTVNEPRYPTATVNLLATTVTADPAAAPGILDLSVDDRLTVSGLPVWLPPGTVSLLARGHAETLGQFEHTITPNCAPDSP